MAKVKKSLTQVCEVLKHLEPSEYEKIPKDVIELIETTKDPDYYWKYDESKELIDQGLDREAIVWLAYINMEYLSTPEQKKLLDEYHKLNEKMRFRKSADLPRKEEEKASEVAEEIVEQKEIAKIEEPKWYQKIFAKLKSLFSKK